MDFETITLELDGGLAELTLNRPDAQNTINLEVAREFHEATLTLERDASLRAVLLRGAGRVFCAGGDLKAFVQREDLPRYVRDVTTHLHAAIARLNGMDAPIVAAVQGAVAGAGLGLAISCDAVVAARSARFVVAYTKIGLTPDGSTSWFLPRLVGLRRALDLTLTNRTLSAEEALDWGLISSVVDDDSLDADVRRLAEDLAAGPTLAFGRAKRLLRGSFDASLERQMELEGRELARSAGTNDGREGVTAFVEKRNPRYGPR